MAAPINDGGPAFPVQEQRSVHGDLIQHSDPGMTLRAYIATNWQGYEAISVPVGEALIGRPIPNCESHGRGYLLDSMKWWVEVEAASRVMHADALIAALDKP